MRACPKNDMVRENSELPPLRSSLFRKEGQYVSRNEVSLYMPAEIFRCLIDSSLRSKWQFSRFQLLRLRIRRVVEGLPEK